MNPEDLLENLAELEHVRALLLELLEQHTPRLRPDPPEDGDEQLRAALDLLLGARRFVLGNPAAARGVHDLLVSEGKRYAATDDGARLRDRLTASAAVDRVRRAWEAASLNVLDGPTAPNGAPDAWVEVLADAIIGHGLHDSLLARLRPEGFA